MPKNQFVESFNSDYEKASKGSKGYNKVNAFVASVTKALQKYVKNRQTLLKLWREYDKTPVDFRAQISHASEYAENIPKDSFEMVLDYHNKFVKRDVIEDEELKVLLGHFEDTLAAIASEEKNRKESKFANLLLPRRSRTIKSEGEDHKDSIFARLRSPRLGGTSGKT